VSYVTIASAKTTYFSLDQNRRLLGNVGLNDNDHLLREGPMAWHFKSITAQTGRRANFGLTAHINPNDLHIHRPTKHVFFQGRNDDTTPDGHIHEFWSDGSDNWQHNDLTINTGAPLAASIAPSSYMFKGEGTKHVIYRDDNGRIFELYWDGNWGHTELAPGHHNAPLTISAPFGYEYSFFDTIHRRHIISQRVVYVSGDNNNIHQLFWPRAHGPDWDHTALTAVPVIDPGAPGGPSAPTAYVFAVYGQTVPGQASQRVLCVGNNDRMNDIGHIYDLTWNEVGPNNHSWQSNDLTVLYGAPLAGPESQLIGLMHDLEFTLHVFYRGINQHLYELYWNDLGWHVNDLTAIMDAELGTGPFRPLPYVHLQQGTLNVNYFGADHHIHALWREVGQAWNPANQQDLIMAAPGAPPALGDPVGFVFRDLTQNIFYIAEPTQIGPFNTGDVIELTDE